MARGNRSGVECWGIRGMACGNRSGVECWDKGNDVREQEWCGMLGWIRGMAWQVI